MTRRVFATQDYALVYPARFQHAGGLVNCWILDRTQRVALNPLVQGRRCAVRLLHRRALAMLRSLVLSAPFPSVGKWQQAASSIAVGPRSLV